MGVIQTNFSLKNVKFVSDWAKFTDFEDESPEVRDVLVYLLFIYEFSHYGRFEWI